MEKKKSLLQGYHHLLFKYFYSEEEGSLVAEEYKLPVHALSPDKPFSLVLGHKIRRSTFSCYKKPAGRQILWL